MDLVYQTEIRAKVLDLMAQGLDRSGVIRGLIDDNSYLLESIWTDELIWIIRNLDAQMHELQPHVEALVE